MSTCCDSASRRLDLTSEGVVVPAYAPGPAVDWPAAPLPEPSHVVGPSRLGLIASRCTVCGSTWARRGA